MWINVIKHRMRRNKRINLKSKLIQKQSIIVRNEAVLVELRRPGFVLSQADEIGKLEQENFLIRKEIEDIESKLKNLIY